MLVVGTVGAFYVWTGQNNLRAHEGLAALAVWSGLSGLEMVEISKGAFLMGSPDTEQYRNEGPQHTVNIRAFSMGKTEVTFAEYFWFAKATERNLPSDNGWGRGNRPVIYVTWGDANAYAEWLSEQAGEKYRLPTEAEWEYAARAGKQAKFSFGNDEAILGEYAWYRANSIGRTHEVGTREPNQWGLRDMHGNVGEWVQDCWNESYESAPDDERAWQAEEDGGVCRRRVFRGGSWVNDPRSLRSSRRDRLSAGNTTDDLGFRLAKDE